MEVECQLMFCRSISDAIYHFNSSLIITIQKVYFEAFDTHFGVLLAGSFQLFVEYIEYCPKNDIEFIVLDEGWYNPKSGDMLIVVPELNLPELIAYGKQKGVDIILWTVFGCAFDNGVTSYIF